jgi:hypothetical protein
MAVLVCFVEAQPASAQEVSHYRGYILESSLESVLRDSGIRATDVKTIHERPARIDEFEWHAPYLSSDGELADPVHDIIFTFYNGTLYQIVVNYARERTDGLTSNDITESLNTTYGSPVARSAISRPAAARRDSVVGAQWENDGSSVTLLRDTYSSFQLIVIAKALSARAHDAILEAIRLDAIEAPRRELERRKKEAVDAITAREQTRTTNKAAFRP